MYSQIGRVLLTPQNVMFFHSTRRCQPQFKKLSLISTPKRSAFNKARSDTMGSYKGTVENIEKASDNMWRDTRRNIFDYCIILGSLSLSFITTLSLAQTRVSYRDELENITYEVVENEEWIYQSELNWDAFVKHCEYVAANSKSICHPSASNFKILSSGEILVPLSFFKESKELILNDQPFESSLGVPPPLPSHSSRKVAKESILSNDDLVSRQQKVEKALQLNF